MWCKLEDREIRAKDCKRKAGLVFGDDLKSCRECPPQTPGACDYKPLKDSSIKTTVGKTIKSPDSLETREDLGTARISKGEAPLQAGAERAKLNRQSKKSEERREHWKYEEIDRAQKFKFEFARRHPRISYLVEQLAKAEPVPGKRTGSKEALNWAKKNYEVRRELREVFHFHPTEVTGFLIAMRFKQHSYINTASINILFQKEGKTFSLPLDYYELSHLKSRKIYNKPKIIEAIQPNDGTITIQIKLYQTNEKIKKDVNFLLGLLYEEAKLQGVKIKEPKHHWDKYEFYLKIFDLKKQGKSDREVAELVFPDEFNWDDNDDPTPENAQRMVKYYFERAVEMIQGGFMEI